MFKAKEFMKLLRCSSALAISGLVAGSLLATGTCGLLTQGMGTTAWAVEVTTSEVTTTTEINTSSSTAPEVESPAVEFLRVSEKQEKWWWLPTINFDGVLPTDGPFTISVERVDGPGRLISAVLNDDGEWTLGLDSTNLERALYLQDPESAVEWWFSDAGRYQLTFNVEAENGTKETYALGFLVGDQGELTVHESHGLGAAFKELGEALRGLDQVIHGDNATRLARELPPGMKEAPAVAPDKAHYHGTGAAPQVVRAPGAPNAPSAAIPARIHPAPAAPAAPPAPPAPAAPPPPPAPATPTNPLATMPAEEGTHPENLHPENPRPNNPQPAPPNQTQTAATHSSQGIWGTLAAGGWVSGFMLGVGAMAFIGGFLLFLASLFIRRQPARSTYDPTFDAEEDHYMTSPSNP